MGWTHSSWCMLLADLHPAAMGSWWKICVSHYQVEAPEWEDMWDHCWDRGNDFYKPWAVIMHFVDICHCDLQNTRCSAMLHICCVFEETEWVREFSFNSDVQTGTLGAIENVKHWKPQWIAEGL